MADSGVVQVIDGISSFINSIASRIPILDFTLSLIPLVIVVAFFLFILVIVMKWLGVEDKFFSDLMKKPEVFVPMLILIMIIMLIANAGGLDLMMGRTNYTGPMGVPTEEITPEDLANPGILLAQPQVAGTLLLLAVFAVVTFMISQKAKK